MMSSIFYILFFGCFVVFAQIPPTIHNTFNVSVDPEINVQCLNYNYCFIEEQSPTYSLFWGIVSNECSTDKPSGIQFDLLETSIEAKLNEEIILGTLRSRNVIIDSSPGAPEDISILMVLYVDNMVIPLHINLNIDETENSEPCAYPSTVPCADRHTYSFPNGESVFEIDGISYKISFPNTDFTLIIQENCFENDNVVTSSPESASVDDENDVNTDFPGEPVDFSVVIQCVNCCPLYIWSDTIARMYLPLQINIQVIDESILPVTGPILVVSLDGNTIITAFEEVTITNTDQQIFLWKPHAMLPGYYNIVFGENTCSEANFKLNVR